MLTVVIPSFYSSKLVEERIKEIEKDVPIIIIENSRDIDFKQRMENKYQNVKINIPNENLGFGHLIFELESPKQIWFFFHNQM